MPHARPLPCPARGALPSACCSCFAACSAPINSAPARLPAKLTVLVQEDHSFYYRNETDEWEGFNHELIDRMQRHLAVPVEIKSFASQEALFQAFEAGQGDIMCPALALNRASPDPTVLTEIARQGFPTLRFKVSDEEDFVWVVRKDLSGVAALLDEWLHTTQVPALRGQSVREVFCAPRPAQQVRPGDAEGPVPAGLAQVSAAVRGSRSPSRHRSLVPGGRCPTRSRIGIPRRRATPGCVA